MTHNGFADSAVLQNGLVCAELGVPSPHSTVPLYHQLQQCKQTGNRNQSKGEKREGAHSEAQEGRVCEEITLPRTRTSTHTATNHTRNLSPVTAPSTESDGSQVHTVLFIPSLISIIIL